MSACGVRIIPVRSCVPAIPTDGTKSPRTGRHQRRSRGDPGPSGAPCKHCSAAAAWATIDIRCAPHCPACRCAACVPQLPVKPGEVFPGDVVALLRCCARARPHAVPRNDIDAIAARTQTRSSCVPTLPEMSVESLMHAAWEDEWSHRPSRSGILFAKGLQRRVSRMSQGLCARASTCRADVLTSPCSANEHRAARLQDATTS